MDRRRFVRHRRRRAAARGTGGPRQVGPVAALAVVICAALVTAAGATSTGATRESRTAMSPGSLPHDITAGADGNLWFSESGGNRIGRMTSDGVVTEFSAGLSPGPGPNQITAGPDGNVWFTETSGNRIGRITPEGEVTEFSAGISPKSAPAGIAAGPDGNLWFAERRGGRIGRITPSGVVTEFSAGANPRGGPYGIVAGPDGNLWFTADGQVGRITTSGVVTLFRAGELRFPGDIVAGPDGNLWFTGGFTYGSHIGRMTPAGRVSWFPASATEDRQPEPVGLAAGPDGNLWYTAGKYFYGRSLVGRMTPRGAVTEFTAGISARSGADKIAAGPGGALWFTESDADRIGRITPRGVVSEFPPTAAIEFVRLRGTHVVNVRLRCPSGAASECGGSVRLVDYQGRRLGVSRVALAPGSRADLAVPLSAAGRRRLRATGIVQLRVVLVPSADSAAGTISRGAFLSTPATRGTLAGSWRRLPTSPLRPRDYFQGATAAWTGRSLVFFARVSSDAGPGHGTRYFNVAASYTPATGRWRRLAPPLGPVGPGQTWAWEGSQRSVWTGTEVIVTGISDLAYNPQTDRWRRLPGPAGPAWPGNGLVVWTGHEMIHWGGGCCADSSNGGAAYNPTTNTWRELAPSPLQPRQSVVGVWTGREMILAGGADGDGHPFTGAAAYDPRTDSWRRIAPLPSARGGATAVWTGREVLVVGGRSGVGLAYNPATDHWHRLPRMEAGNWSGASAVWTGRRLLIWGGQAVRGAGLVVAPRGLSYEPAGNRWLALPLSPLRGREGAVTAAWSGRQVIVLRRERADPEGWRIGGAVFTPKTP